jgi:hypothetical protein
MFGSSRPFARGLMASVAALAIVSGLFMVDSATRSMADPPAQTVNRALKGDRLPLGLASLSHVENRPVEWPAPRPSIADLKLPDGCEAVVSSIANPELAHIAGRCVS